MWPKASLGDDDARARASRATVPQVHALRATRRWRDLAMMDALIFFINKVMVPGFVTGCVYALGAIGVTLIFGILRFAHFAHGDMMTLGGFVSFLLALIFYHYGISFPL